ncbi:ABC transporter substrate-binding protein [Brachybacterium sp. J153]|uniref:ABC transporter substrate-binding protein n=1 Tax=Brachybacterium sp. J153 TaxID=3116488 RepID=UPI002E78A80E|nr:extracellular solute-binding protein [Brachybacterium sp. J153]MEE1618702.1 extracellular solute-binding protein [Brachybacterium sp. J153]
MLHHPLPLPVSRPRRRSVLGLGAAALGGMTLAACGGNSDEPADVASQNVGAMESYEADQQFTATEPFSLSILWTDWPENPVTESWKLFDHIEELTGVRLEPTHVPFSDNVEKRSLLLSAGDAPSVIPLMYRGDETPFVSSGAILPLSDYVEHMPHFRKYVEEWDAVAMLDNIRQADGKHYLIPGLQEVWVPAFSLVIRRDVWDEVGIGVPATWDEVREGLRLIKESYPESVPLADGFEGQSLINYGGYAFGTRAGWGFGDGMIKGQDGPVEYAAATAEYRDMVEYYRSLVEEGLLDPESLTASNDGSGGGGVHEKFAAETCFAASGSSGTLIEFAQALDATVGRGNYQLELIPPPAGPAGNIMGPRNFWHGFVLSSHVAESENFLATLQFLDWLYFNPAAREMLRWGIEGETYTKAEDGTITLDAEHSLTAFDLNPDGGTDLQKDLGFSTYLAESTESRALKESYNSADYTTYIDGVLENLEPMPPWTPAPLDEAELEQAALMATPLKDAVDTATLQFILGQRDIEEWDAFQQELEAAGLPAYLDLVNTARDRFEEQS